MLYYQLENDQRNSRQEKAQFFLSVSVRKKPMVANPVADVRFDGVHHWPEFEDIRN